MQSSNEEEKPEISRRCEPAQDPELSEAWRALLGLQSSGTKEGAPRVDPAAQVQPLASDPWSHLLQSQGMQPVDLQKIHLHDLHPTANEDDVEHALDIMREATGQLPSLDKKTGEA